MVWRRPEVCSPFIHADEFLKTSRWLATIASGRACPARAHSPMTVIGPTKGFKRF